MGGLSRSGDYLRKMSLFMTSSFGEKWLSLLIIQLSSFDLVYSRINLQAEGYDGVNRP